jgi:hypothetical protein
MFSKRRIGNSYDFHFGKMEKKGLSAVVVTVLLIFITTVAGVIIAGYLVPLVRDNLNEGSECFDFREYFTFDDQFDYNCYELDKVSGDYRYAVSVKAKTMDRENSEKVTSFVLGFDGISGVSNSIEVPLRDISDFGEGVGQIRRIEVGSPLEFPVSGEVRTYVYNNGAEKVEEIKIAPILDSGKVCDVTDRIKTVSNICTNVITVP